ncbi:MAG TPA: hypothetical protein VFK06_24005 [Candidatus Angelobacter sp.]|nr:hypothetical protein [Candidatus Angelobacter sp.]
MAYELENELIQHELEDEYSGEGEGELEDEYEFEAGLEGEGWLGAIGNAVGSLLGESEDEYEGEGEFEFESEAEDEISPIRKIYSDAMMEHLGELAFEAESEDEAAEHFLPLIGMAASKLLPIAAKAIAPVARKALPKIVRAVTRATPRLTKGIGRVAKTLHRNPQTRHLLKTVPAIARRTVGSIARQAAHGRRISPRVAVKTLARQARHVLAHPQHRRHALRHHNHLERRFHHRWGRGVARPHLRGQAYLARAAAVPPGYAAPGAVYRPGVATPAAGAWGRTSNHAPCPTCGVSSAQGSTTQNVTPTPAYCRCCGQVLR